MKRSAAQTKTPKLPGSIKENESLNALPNSMMKSPRRLKDPEKNTLAKSAIIMEREDPSFIGKDTQDNASDDRIKVFLRMRPILQREKLIKYSINNDTIKIQPEEIQNSSYFCVDKVFSFRKIFDQDTTQEQIFDEVAKPLLDDFLKGNDILIFCYGSTNAGKTYTISGSNDNPGILKRSLDYVVPMIVEERRRPKIFVSYIEIYNERIYDLLNINKSKQQSLTLGFSKSGDTEVKNARELQINSIDDISNVVKQGEIGRHRGSTELNCDSSRSHTIFRLKIQRKNKECWLQIVDLAGSERLSAMNSTKGSFKEACNINKSMLVLGKCIRKLKQQSTSSGKSHQIPYRESKLTHLFKNFFEPVNRPSHAAMIINVSPSSIQSDDTIFALQFAAEASQCMIRQIASPVGGFFDSTGDSDDSDDEPEEETDEEIEERIRKMVTEEMEALISKREEEMSQQIQSLNDTYQSISTNRFETLTLIKQHSQPNSPQKNPKIDYQAQYEEIHAKKQQIDESNLAIREEIEKCRKRLEELKIENQEAKKQSDLLASAIESINKQNIETEELIKTDQCAYKADLERNTNLNIEIEQIYEQISLPPGPSKIDKSRKRSSHDGTELYQPEGRIKLPPPHE